MFSANSTQPVVNALLTAAMPVGPTGSIKKSSTTVITEPPNGRPSSSTKGHPLLEPDEFEPEITVPSVKVIKNTIKGQQITTKTFPPLNYRKPTVEQQSQDAVSWYFRNEENNQEEDEYGISNNRVALPNINSSRRPTDDDEEEELLDEDNEEEPRQSLPVTPQQPPLPEPFTSSTEWKSLIASVESLSSRVEALGSKVDTSLQNVNAKLVILEGRVRFVEEQLSTHQQQVHNQTQEMIRQRSQENTIQKPREEETDMKASYSSTFLTSVPESMLSRSTTGTSTTSSSNTSKSQSPANDVSNDL